jgi:hypothetical protein
MKLRGAALKKQKLSGLDLPALNIIVPNRISFKVTSTCVSVPIFACMQFLTYNTIT